MPRLGRSAGVLLGMLIVLAIHPLAAAASSIAETSTPATSTLTIALPSTCAAKATVHAIATLTDTTGTPLPGRVVRIRRLYPSASVLASGVTDSNGRISAAVSPHSKWVVQAFFGGDAEYLPSESATAAIKPRILIWKPWLHDAFAVPGQKLLVRGTLWPKHSSASTATVVECQRLESGSWVTRARYRTTISNTRTVSHYSAAIKLPKTGSWRVRIKHDDASHALTRSKAFAVTVTRWRDRYAGKKVRGFSTSHKMVAITIDDGPNKRTLDICSILERYGARGTFFFTERLLKRGYANQARKAYFRGHEIANHTVDHAPLTGTYAHDRREVLGTMRFIERAIGVPTTWVRAMGGEVDATGLHAVRNSGQLYCNWSIDSLDSHQHYLPPSTIYHNVVRSVHKGDVILIHQTHPESVKALPRICRYLRSHGYKMVTLSRLASLSRPR